MLLCYGVNVCGQGVPETVDEVPDWFLQPPKGEYVGVSLPFQNSAIARQQATYVALISYMLQHDIEWEFSRVDRVAESTFRSASQIALSLPAQYELVKTAKNKHGEMFVSLKVLSAVQNPNTKVVVEIDISSVDGVGKRELKFVLSDKTPNVHMLIHIHDCDDGVDQELNGKAEMIVNSVDAIEETYNQTQSYVYRPTINLVNQHKTKEDLLNIIVEEGGNIYSLKNSIGNAYLMVMLDMFERTEMENMRFVGSIKGSTHNSNSSSYKRKATPIREIQIYDNTLFMVARTRLTE
ncbi:hypothetical protein FACS1894201_11780 [Bacteroidia bacterium]|nr:hypothetical protein FACS1894201_11780 [Bacteroidia bacterium]